MNLLYLYLGQGLGAVYYMVVFNGVMTLFLLKAGVKEFLLGILTILFPLIGVCSVLFLPWIERNYTRNLYRSGTFVALISFALLPLFLLMGRITFSGFLIYYLVVIILYFIGIQIFSLTWVPAVSDTIREDRGMFFGRLRLLIIVFTLAAFALTYLILGQNPGFLEFFWVFLLLCLTQCFRPVLFSKFVFTPGGPPRPMPHLERFRLVWRDEQFRSVVRFLFAVYFVGQFVTPFLVPFLQLELGLSASTCIFLFSVSLTGYGLASYLWGKINDLKGSRFVLFSAVMCGVIFWGTLAQIKFFPEPLRFSVLTALYLFLGIANAAFDLGTITRQIAVAKDDMKFSFLAYSTILGTQLPIVLSAPLGGFVIEKNRHLCAGPYGIYSLVFMGAALADIALLMLIVRMKPLKEKTLAAIWTDVYYAGMGKLRELIVSP